MKTILKWPGGKEKELPLILENMPAFTGRYIEPFVGGGALFWALEGRRSCINDKAPELVGLYRCARDGDAAFAAALLAEYGAFRALDRFAQVQEPLLLAFYAGEAEEGGVLSALRRETDPEMKAFLRSAAGENGDEAHLYGRIRRSLTDKRTRTRRLEERNGALGEGDRCANMETALKAGFYLCVRDLWNRGGDPDSPGRAALFFFLREYCYSSMFRYNARGEFNVPYGGISYNRKDLRRKIDRLCSEEVRHKLADTQISCLDFEEFLRGLQLTEDDFVFVDPPYDSDFSEYAGNRFDRQEQIRLRNCLRELPAKVMAVMGASDFVYDLYKDDFAVRRFDKKYLVSFMNRNERRAEHLLITNYES